MLKVECSECRSWIHSPYLVELETLKCPTCGAEVPVRDVFITAGPYSIYRDALQKHVFKYQRLLAEAEKEIEDLQKEGKGARSYDVSTDSIKTFITHLKEMLEGCRNGFRVNAEDINVNCYFRNSGFKGKIINISSTGACIDTLGSVHVPLKGEAVTVEISQHPSSAGLKLFGELVWSGKGAQIGVRFVKMDSSLREALLGFIKERLPDNK